MTSADLLGPFGLLVGMVSVISAFVTGRVVTRTHLNDIVGLYKHENDEIRKDRDYWRQIALSATPLAAKALQLAKEAKEEAPV